MFNLGGMYRLQPYVSRPGSAPQTFPVVPRPQQASPYAGANGQQQPQQPANQNWWAAAYQMTGQRKQQKLQNPYGQQQGYYQW